MGWSRKKKCCKNDTEPIQIWIVNTWLRNIYFRYSTLIDTRNKIKYSILAPPVFCQGVTSNANAVAIFVEWVLLVSSIIMHYKWIVLAHNHWQASVSVPINLHHSTCAANNKKKNFHSTSIQASILLPKIIQHNHKPSSLSYAAHVHGVNYSLVLW